MRYPKNFFKIEEIRSDFEVGMFKGSLNNLIELRENNRRQDKPLNSSFPYYPEEKKLITKMYLEKKSMGEIIDYFQRPENSIRKTLGTLLKKNLKNARKVSITDLFFEAILNGADPITGEVLENNSPWRHAKIISDINLFFEDKKYAETDNKKKTKDQETWSLVDIKDWVKTNDDEVDIVIIQQGYYFAVLDEDAVLCKEEFGLELFRVYENSVLQTGFPVIGIEKYINLFEERNFKYVVVEQTGSKHPNGRMIRKITFPEVPGQEGREF